MTITVDIKNLRKQFGPFTAVDDVSFKVSQGEVLGFLGPNGAGKSTTMKMITGFLTPTSGTVSVGGHDIVNDALAAKKLIGYLPEGAPAYPDMTVGAFLEFIADIRGLHGAEKARRVAQMIEQINLQGVVHQPIETLSKGFKRRVGLAQAIMHDPAVLIMDEPTDGLDPNQKHEVRKLIKSIAKEKVIILSTHILEEVEAVCTRAIIIANGKLVDDGTPSDLEAKSAYHNAVTLTLNAGGHEAKDIRQALQNVAGVARVETLKEEASRLSYQVFPHGGRAIAAALSKQARDANWDIAELHVEHGRLDEVFRTLTTAA